MHHGIAGVVAAVQSGIQQNDMAVDAHARLPFGRFHVPQVDVAEIWNMGEVEADRPTHEEIEGHFVDGLPAGLHMIEGVDVSSDVIEHSDRFNGRCEGIAGRSLIVGEAALMRHPFEIDRTRHVLVRRHVVLDGDRKINYVDHSSPMTTFVLYKERHFGMGYTFFTTVDKCQEQRP